jgi:hypothetical protein
VHFPLKDIGQQKRDLLRLNTDAQCPAISPSLTVHHLRSYKDKTKRCK